MQKHSAADSNFEPRPKSIPQQYDYGHPKSIPDLRYFRVSPGSASLRQFKHVGPAAVAAQTVGDIVSGVVG